MFTKAIVRKPCRNIIHGISSARMGKPVYQKALKQHEEYVKALHECGLKVFVLDASEDFPDSVFVEDTAVLTKDMAVLCNPGDHRRNKETTLIEPALKQHFNAIESIQFPATLDGGDVMMVDRHFYIGLSERTNQEGASQFIQMLKGYNFTGSVVTLKEVLHLKTGVNYLDNNNLLVSGAFVDKPVFERFNRIIIPENEAYAANSLWINGTVLVPYGFPETLHAIQKAGYKTMEVDVSEFQKLDGGLSCLSLRF